MNWHNQEQHIKVDWDVCMTCTERKYLKNTITVFMSLLLHKFIVGWFAALSRPLSLFLYLIAAAVMSSSSTQLASPPIPIPKNQNWHFPCSRNRFSLERGVSCSVATTQSSWWAVVFRKTHQYKEIAKHTHLFFLTQAVQRENNLLGETRTASSAVTGGGNISLSPEIAACVYASVV